MKRYGTEAQCETAFQHARWPDSFFCPRCQATAATQFIRYGHRYWQRVACRRQTNLRSGTLMEQSKPPLCTWLLVMYLLGQSNSNLSALELMRHLGVSYPAAWRMKHKLTQAMAEREASRQLGGVVQLDDAYLGGAQRRQGGARLGEQTPFCDRSGDR